MPVQTREKKTTWLDSLTYILNQRGEEKSYSETKKNCLWRLARKSLPIGDVVHHRFMADRSACVVCGEEDSNWNHFLVDCHMIRSGWALMPEENSEMVLNLHEPHAKVWLVAATEALSARGNDESHCYVVGVVACSSKDHP
jgi:hypothetical protein